jgi:hypothetical protein
MDTHGESQYRTHRVQDVGWENELDLVATASATLVARGAVGCEGRAPYPFRIGCTGGVVHGDDRAATSISIRLHERGKGSRQHRTQLLRLSRIQLQLGTIYDGNGKSSGRPRGMPLVTHLLA